MRPGWPATYTFKGRPYSKNIGRKWYLHIVLENKRKNDKEFKIHLFNLEYIEKIIFYIFAGISI